MKDSEFEPSNEALMQSYALRLDEDDLPRRICSLYRYRARPQKANVKIKGFS